MNTGTRALVNLHALEFLSKRPSRKAAPETRRKVQTLRKLASSELLRKYDIRKNRFGASSIVPVLGQTCSGCWVTLSLNTLRQAHERLTECEHCARLLYNPSRRKRLCVTVAETS